ncbi:MAG: DUF1501 domain-containing protein [Chryseotalea sp.]|jgi:uncharacterized protein (DUF1501 family)
MKRRNFLKKLPITFSIPFTLANIPVNVMAENMLTRLARKATNDRVMIILQLHGGNDGLNSVIPVDQYELYYNARPNIAIPSKNSARKMITLDSTLPLNKQVALHPDMPHLKALYDQGRMNIVQGVSYENNNGSHFRGRDISFMGGGAEDYFSSGWLGRYLEKEYRGLGSYPDNFPNATMPYPLAIETGNDVSLIFHQQNNIPTSISLNDPEGFAKLVDELAGFEDEQNIDPRGIPPEWLDKSPYYKEMEWILGLEKKSDDYAQILFEAYQRGGATSVVYPERYPLNAPRGSLRNGLSPQLQMIARLLAGGCSTKVFLVRLGGFDTHADQVESYDPTMGVHAALMYHISSTINAFQLDLRARGLEDRVLTVTTSEFGRRVYSNGSYGTDHGTGGPIFIFGKGVEPGVVGNTPNLSGDNVDQQYDYREIYANLLKDWMGVDKTVIENEIFYNNFIDGTVSGVSYQPLPLANPNAVTGIEDFLSSRFKLEDAFPNPAQNETTFKFRINQRENVSIDLFDNNGKQVKRLVQKEFLPGLHEEKVSLSGILAGHYIYTLQAGFYHESKKLVIL